MKLNKYTFIALAGLLLSSCGEDNSTAVENGTDVSLNFSVEALGMQPSGGGVSTRCSSGALDMVFGDDAAAATRADKDAKETDIKTLYLVQFNGTATGSTVVKSGVIVRHAADNTVVFDFLAVNAACRVYLVANFNPNAANGTTLANFQKSMATYTATAAIDATVGIPMCDYKDFNPTTVSIAPKFSMTAMVAKLTVRYTVDAAALAELKPGTTATSLNVELKNIASGTAYPPTATPATAYRPAGITFSDKAVGNTGATYTYYVPENVAGNSTTNITDWKKRSIKNAPENALYFEITGRDAADKGTVIIASFLGDPAKPKEFNINRNYAYTLTATIKNVKTGLTDERITVKPDYFNLNESLGNKYANCYIISENASKDYGFDATKQGTGTGSGLSAATEARVLWQTGSTTSVVKAVRLEGGKVIFTTGTATEGNAVIGIFASSAANAPCIWSWHIWKVSGAPSTVACVKTPSPASASANFRMMDRNLGAYNNTPGNVGSIGLLYQWGRKDPFPGPAGFSTAEPTNIYGSYNKGGTTGSWNGGYSVQTVPYTTGGTEAWAVKYPTAFVLYNSTTGDWLVTKNDNLWGTPWLAAGSVGGYNGNQGAKSIYDPCPVGYRVPPQDTWSRQTTGNGTYANNGITLNSVASGFWFPAAGFRSNSSGVLNNSPGNGYCWSSSLHSATSVRSGSLYFTSSGSVYPQNDDRRGYGYSVRCVSE